MRTLICLLNLSKNSSRWSFFFPHNTMNIPKILVTYNLCLRLSIHWPQFWDSGAAHSTASFPPWCRKISMCCPFGVEKLACALLLVDLRLQISWWDALCSAWIQGLPELLNWYWNPSESTLRPPPVELTLIPIRPASEARLMDTKHRGKLYTFRERKALSNCCTTIIFKEWSDDKVVFAGCVMQIKVDIMRFGF